MRKLRPRTPGRGTSPRATARSSALMRKLRPRTPGRGTSPRATARSSALMRKLRPRTPGRGTSPRATARSSALMRKLRPRTPGRGTSPRATARSSALMRKLIVLLLVLCVLAVAVLGFHVAEPFDDARETSAKAAGFCPAPSRLATPPVGARIGLSAWTEDALLEAWYDAMPFLLAEIVLLAAALRLVSPDDDRKRLRSCVLLFAAYLVTLP